MPIDPRQLEIVTEFCRIAGKPDMIEYLALRPGCTPEEAQEALRKRRKYMQGMQANPKYKNEAVHFIKNFSTFQTVLGDPAEYMLEVVNKQERANLPVLEMSIKSAMRGGELSSEQVDYLKRNASQLGIGENTFIGTLTKLVNEAGAHLPAGTPVPAPPAPPVGQRTITPSLAPADAAAPEPQKADGPLRPLENHRPANAIDPYAVLGARREMPLADIREIYHDRLRRARTLPRQQAEAAVAELDTAWLALANQSLPGDLARRATGPPARDRDNTEASVGGASPLAAPTAPPVRQRQTMPPTRSGGADFTPVAVQSGPVGPRALTPSLSPGLPHDAVTVEIRGTATRQVRITDSPISMPIFVVLYDADLPGARVATDEPWLTAQPSRLDPGRKEHEVSVRIDPGGLTGTSATGTVTVQTDRGGRASVTFQVERAAGTPVWMYIAGGSLAVLAALALVYLIASYALMAN